MDSLALEKVSAWVVVELFWMAIHQVDTFRPHREYLFSLTPPGHSVTLFSIATPRPLQPYCLHSPITGRTFLDSGALWDESREINPVPATCRWVQVFCIPEYAGRS